MSISSDILSVKQWCEMLYELYNSTLKKLPNPKITSPDGQYYYELRKEVFSDDLPEKEQLSLKEKYEIEMETKAERFAYQNRFLYLHYDDIYKKYYWLPNKPIEKSTVINNISNLIFPYQSASLFCNMLADFTTTKTYSMCITLLLQVDIFDGISNTFINQWLKDCFITIHDAKILVENTKKFFSQYLA